MPLSTAVLLRTTPRPGDIGRISQLHGELYAREQGWNAAFEAYVAEGLARFVLEQDPDADRIWIAEAADRLIGSVAIVGRPEHTAQLRWFLVHPDARGTGLGRHLLEEALAFCRGRGLRSVFLWTAAGLPAAAHLYRSVGFRLVEERPPHDQWGRPVVEQRFELRL